MVLSFFFSVRSLINKIRKRQVTFLDHVMRKEKVEHLVTTGKRSKEKQSEKMLDELSGSK